MSDTPIEVLKIKAVEVHPQAAHLEVVKVLDTQFISGEGNFQAGDLCVYFPPDMLIPEAIAGHMVCVVLGVANYLKHSIYPGDLNKTQCRIGVIRFHGVASFGFGVSTVQAERGMLYASNLTNGIAHLAPSKFAEGDDLTSFFKGEKYQPSCREGSCNE